MVKVLNKALALSCDSGNWDSEADDELPSSEVWGEAEEDEKKFLTASAEHVTRQQIIDASWMAESIGCLLWALRLIADPPAFDQEFGTDIIRIVTAAPPDELVKGADLRPENEIDRRRDVAELWHWRSRTRQLQEEGSLKGTLPGGKTIEEIIELAATTGAQNGDLPQPIAADFPALGKPYRDLTWREYAMVTSIAQERHRAFNWLCGFSETGRWADTPTDT